MAVETEVDSATGESQDIQKDIFAKFKIVSVDNAAGSSVLPKDDSATQGARELEEAKARQAEVSFLLLFVSWCSSDS